MQERSYDEGNIIIAEFMRRKFYAYNSNSSYAQPFDTYEECMQFIRDKKLKGYKPELYWNGGCGMYHKDWNLMMEVIQKIEVSSIDDFTLPCVNICTKQIEISHSKPSICIKKYEDKLEATWMAVVEYISWYNLKTT